MTREGYTENDSILTSVKKKIGIAGEYNHFDHDVLTEINQTLATLFQVGAGSEFYNVVSAEDTWEDFFTNAGIANRSILELIKEYVYIGVRLMFDPPDSSAVMESLKQKKEELEWRIYLDEDLLLRQ